MPNNPDRERHPVLALLYKLGERRDELLATLQVDHGPRADVELVDSLRYWNWHAGDDGSVPFRAGGVEHVADVGLAGTSRHAVDNYLDAGGSRRRGLNISHDGGRLIIDDGRRAEVVKSRIMLYRTRCQDRQRWVGFSQELNRRGARGGATA